MPSNRYYELRPSKIQGRGAFALRPIRKGTRIDEYVGEVIDQDEADRRYDDAQMKRHHTFLFSLDNGKVIDAAVGGNDSRFINHSCDPNCQAIETRSRIFIEALRSIGEGEELVYDYAFERQKDTTEEDEKLYMCKCGAPNCRGTILAPEKKGRGRGMGARKGGAKKKGSVKTKGSTKKGGLGAKKKSGTKAGVKKGASKGKKKTGARR
jgi:uncharacterized protein